MKPDLSSDETSPAAPSPSTNPAKKQFKIPPILLEADETISDLANTEAGNVSPGPITPVEPIELEGELPQAYGTEKLLLTARDPHWLYAHWDLTLDQQRQYCARSADGCLALRIYHDEADEQPTAQIRLHPDARYSFVRVQQASATYVAQLGCVQTNGQWLTISTSIEVFTPPDTMSSDSAVEFATIPIEIPQEELISPVERSVTENAPPAGAVENAPTREHDRLPALPPVSNWSAEQDRALAKVIGSAISRNVPMSSLEISELIQRGIHGEISSQSGAEFAGPAAPTSPGGISSPHGGQEREKSFWFNVNAELIVYGATEPDAKVSIGGHKIKLRPDGSFSFRFALPDGKYELPVVAVSVDKTETRAAELKFSRATEFQGDVGAHPQDSNLKPPTADYIKIP